MVAGVVGWRAWAWPSALFGLSPVPRTGQQGPGFPAAPTRVVIARPTPPQARPSHPGGPPVSGTLVSKGGRVSLGIPGEEVLWWGMERAGPKAPLSQQGAGLGTNASLAQMVSGLVGQLLMQPVLVGESSFFPQTSEISVATLPP